MRNTTTIRWRSGHAGFTLVELLVVIAIIGTLAALLLVAARGALAAAKRAQIRAETTQIATALEDYKNSVGSYPPNTQTDGTSGTAHLNDTVVLSNFKRHFNKAFPNQREPSQLIEALVGMSDLAPGDTPTQANQGATNLPGGMNAAEAMVFWMGGFSDDPKYPISGPGGPGYSIVGTLDNHLDPITDRNWRLGIDVAQLGPRALEVNSLGAEGSYFPAAYPRFVEYWNPRTSKINRINFWYLKAPGSEVPYVYFDASRGSGASGENDTPAATQQDSQNAAVDYAGDAAMIALFKVHAVKALQSNANANLTYTYANDGKFQIIHSGIDDAWGSFPMIDPNTNDPNGLIDSASYYGGSVVPSLLFFPEGPWTGELADTQTNFSDGTLEDSQP